jgi:translation initiation factor 3 subunit B
LAVVEHRRNLLDEWLAWREMVVEEVSAERRELGLPEDPLEGLIKETDEGENQVIEEIVEEIVEETEEIIA